MPPNSSYKKNGKRVGKGGKPAIQMEQADHYGTASHGNSAYVLQQKKLIAFGYYRLALMRDIADIRAKFGDKYDIAIGQMLVWTKCMKYI